MGRRPSRKDPKYREHKTGQAVVRIAGRDYYLGKHDSDESREEYHRLLAEWRSSGSSRAWTPRNRNGKRGADELTIVQLILLYLDDAEREYQKHGRETSEMHCIRSALRFVRELYSRSVANLFGPVALGACRDQMIDAGLAYSTVNAYVHRIRRMFRWGGERQLIQPSVYGGLVTLRSLDKDSTRARVPDPVTVVPDDHVNATLPYLCPQLRATVEVQRLTGMRPGEVVGLRRTELNTKRDEWEYRPKDHKTAHRGKKRVIIIGPRAQKILRPYLHERLTRPLFSPREAENARNQLRREARKSPMTPSQARRRRKASPMRTPSDQYTVDSYRRAVARACDKAGVPRWTPNQLRHNAATKIRAYGDLEYAQEVLGHESPNTTETYAERSYEKARKVMWEIG